MAEDIGNNDPFRLRHVALDELRVDLAGAESARHRARQRSRNQGFGSAGAVAGIAAIVVVASTVAAGRHDGRVQPGVSTDTTTSVTTAPTTTAPTTTEPAPTTTAAALPVPAATGREAVPPPVVTATTPSVGAAHTTPPAAPATFASSPVTQSSPTGTSRTGLVNAVNGFGAVEAVVPTASGHCVQVDLRQLLEGSAADAWAAAHPARAERLGNLAVIADPDGAVLHCIPLAANAKITVLTSSFGNVVAKAATVAMLADLTVQQTTIKPSPPGVYWLPVRYCRWHLDSVGAIDRIDAYFIP